MSKIIDLGVEKDHIESLTRASGITAISELIWNALDADSTIINVDYKKNVINLVEEIKVSDNGSGITYSKAQEVFGRLGGSEKKTTNISPNGRPYHGKEGKGRYKSLALGDLVTFNSRYKTQTGVQEFTITLDHNDLSRSQISDLRPVKDKNAETGFIVTIQNINQESGHQALDRKNRKDLEQKFASYWINYPDFSILFNGHKLEFESLIKNSDEKEITIQDGALTYRFCIKILEWNFDIKKKAYLCSVKGVPFRELNLGIRSSIPISIFIQSNYVEKLHKENRIDLENFDDILQNVYGESKKFARDYVRRRLHQYSGEFITELKSKGIYPYQGDADNVVEVSKRQVFDIVALQIHEYLPTFDDQDDQSKKFTLTLIKEALEKDSNALQRILSEIIELPEEKRVELAEILQDTSLSNIIDTMTEIKNRLHLLNGLEQIIYNSDLNANIKERKHLHKIIVNETWMFGDNYTYGVDDVTLKNVLKAYIRDSLHRDDFQEIVDEAENADLQTIPDVCLWQQYSMGNAGKENLIIELKKPTVDAGFTEKTQIESYATKVSNDPRFPKEKTKWKFLLITRDIKKEIEPFLQQKNRKYGHVTEGDNFDVYILPWGHILSEAKLRHEFIKEKLNLNLQDNEEGLEYLRKKYKEYLPADFNILV